jgi:hypothetical protein
MLPRCVSSPGCWLVWALLAGLVRPKGDFCSIPQFALASPKDDPFPAVEPTPFGRRQDTEVALTDNQGSKSVCDDWLSVLATAARAPPALWDASAQEDAALAEVTTAGRTWHAGHALGMRLASDWAGLVRDKLVLEVGTGTGVAGLAAASAGARRVLLTDLHLQTAQRNVDI